MNIIIYSLIVNNNFSGGLSIIRTLFEKIKVYLPNNIFVCPPVEDIPELHYKSVFNKKIEHITNDEFKSLFTVNMHKYVITQEILAKKDNIVIYPENIIGNPLQQKYVIRWLLFFPTEKSAESFNYKYDLIFFYDHNYYGLYKYICKDLKMEDYLTENIKNPKFLKIIRMEIDKFKDHKLTRNGTCTTVRKGYPPYTFCNKTTRQMDFLSITNKLKNISNNFNFEFENRFNDDQIIYLFNIKEKFTSHDLFTFYNIQASLCGCISTVKPVSNIPAEEYYKDPTNKYGVSYGDEFIEHAKKTMKYVRDYQYSLFYSTEINFPNLFKYIEEHFKINLNIDYNSIDNKNEQLKLLYHKNRLDLEILLDKHTLSN